MVRVPFPAYPIVGIDANDRFLRQAAIRKLSTSAKCASMRHPDCWVIFADVSGRLSPDPLHAESDIAAWTARPRSYPPRQCAGDKPPQSVPPSGGLSFALRLVPSGFGQSGTTGSRVMATKSCFKPAQAWPKSILYTFCAAIPAKSNHRIRHGYCLYSAPSRQLYQFS
jgi:hypothetical protein